MNYRLILARIAESPEATEQLTCAMVYCHTENWDLVRLHSAAAADLLAEKYPGEYDPLKLCAVLTAAFLQDARNRAAAPLN